MKINPFVLQKNKFIIQAISFLKTDSKLITNMASLGLVQFTNFVIPILIYPYLFRKIGDSYFGAVTYALNIMIYLTMFTDYGFNLSAPRAVALARENLPKLSQIVSGILQTKFYFFILCCLITGVGIILIPRFSDDSYLYSFGIIYIAGGCVMPLWLFQGMEDMRHLTWINVLAKIGSMLLIVILIREPADYKYVVGLFGAANLLSGVVGIIYAFYKYKLIFKWQPIEVIVAEIRNGWYFFVSNFSAVIFSNSTIIILGFFATDDIVGKYGIAEKITFALWQLISLFSQATYPVLCRLASESHVAVTNFIRRYYILFTLFIGILCTFVNILASQLIYLATGSEQPDAVTLLRILSFLPLIVCLNAPAYQVLLIYQKQKYNALIFNISIFFSLLICTFLTAFYGANGAATAAVITQIVVTLSLHWTLERYFPAHTLWATHK
ncbi:oligosaccharide flippase family protein [Spirosoma sp. HMF3257]|uniref:Uncharacterized protein n=1 Tax=Spirosoma telluris TaxID=2183553 RepID=A0A327NNW2_9BACT|nr:oligosaccharide flippase family protein [Spirosoma telluris]RAI76099.1 hypothetical protein HMF3257_21375 [Spirosoma telluris]